MTPRALALAALSCALAAGTEAAAQSVTNKDKPAGPAAEARAEPKKTIGPAVRIEIVSLNAARGRAKVCVRTEDRGGGMGKVALLVDGEQAASSPPETAIAETGEECPSAATFDIDVIPGLTQLEATAFADDNVTRSAPVRDSIRIRTSTDTTTLHILTVGINEYGRNGPGRLAYARDDARAFADSLQRQSRRLFARVRVHSLYDGAATKDSILSKILQLADSVRPTDTFIFFYAGHGTVAEVKGVNMFLLLPVDVTGELTGPRLFLGNGLRAGELHESINLIRASSKLLVFDACNTAALGQYFAEKENLPTLNSLRPTDNVGILAAAGPSSPAKESATLRQGFFTAALLYNRPKPGERPRIQDVAQFITQTMNAWNQLSKTNPAMENQLPWMRAPVAGDFQLIVKPLVPQG